MEKLDYRFKLRIDDREREILWLTERSSENVEHIILKLLAYCYLCDYSPEVEKKIDQRYKPDVVVNRGRKIKHWAECGSVSPGKMSDVQRKNREAELYLFRTGRSAALSMKRLLEQEDVEASVIYFEPDSLKWISRNLRKHNDLDVRRKKPVFDMDLNEETREVKLHYA